MRNRSWIGPDVANATPHTMSRMPHLTHTLATPHTLMQTNSSRIQEQVHSLEDMQSRSLATLRMRRRVVRTWPLTPPPYAHTPCMSYLQFESTHTYSTAPTLPRPHTAQSCASHSAKSEKEGCQVSECCLVDWLPRTARFFGDREYRASLTACRFVSPHSFGNLRHGLRVVRVPASDSLRPRTNHPLP